MRNWIPIFTLYLLLFYFCTAFELADSRSSLKTAMLLRHNYMHYQTFWQCGLNSGCLQALPVSVWLQDNPSDWHWPWDTAMATQKTLWKTHESRKHTQYFPFEFASSFSFCAAQMHSLINTKNYLSIYAKATSQGPLKTQYE